MTGSPQPQSTRVAEARAASRRALLLFIFAMIDLVVAGGVAYTSASWAGALLFFAFLVFALFTLAVWLGSRRRVSAAERGQAGPTGP